MLSRLIAQASAASIIRVLGEHRHISTLYKRIIRAYFLPPPPHPVIRTDLQHIQNVTTLPLSFFRVFASYDFFLNAMSEPDNLDFIEPPSAGNFLQRYREARNASSPPTPSQAAPASPPPPASLRSQPVSISRADNAKKVWGSVFHPLGRSPTSADRYDLSRGQKTSPGFSASELHAMGSGISLDQKED